jgi:flavin reductase (DIM6/NTAB) family NADH-FMN oxidoreductase RutF
MPVDEVAFRRAAGQFPTGIVVVATSLDGIGHAMTVSAFTSVSLHPLLVMFCAEKIARFHDAVVAAGTWAVSILDDRSEKVARWLATRGRPLQGQLDAIPHHFGPLTGAPILDGALAALECRTTALYDGGDHTIVVGEVIGVSEPCGESGPPVDGAPVDRPTGAGPAGAAGASPAGASPAGAGPTGAGPAGAAGAWSAGAGPAGAGPNGAAGAWSAGAGPTGAGPNGAGPTGAGPLIYHAGRYRRLAAPDPDLDPDR